MTTQDRDSFFTDAIREAIATATKTSQAIADVLKDTTIMIGDTVGAPLHRFVEQGTETVGQIVTPFAENPVVQFATRVPGLSWLMAAMGQVNVERVQREVEALQRQYPLDSHEQLAQRVIANAAWKAAGIGLVTNFIPPLALTLFAVDVGAIAALQAEMIYRIAVIYGFSPTEPTRRGEVLAIWGLSSGSSGILKTGLSVVELIPALGTFVGTTGDAAILYGLGYLACQFYEKKQQSYSPCRSHSST